MPTNSSRDSGTACIWTTRLNVEPWGGREGDRHQPVVDRGTGADGRIIAVDIANTAVARGKIYLAKNRGEPIPDTWAMGPDGAPTTDAAEGVLGVILPMAGHKGYAISFLMDVLSGALTGSGVGTDVTGPYEPEGSSRCGHLFLALDPAAFGDRAGYEARVEGLVAEVKGVPLAPGFLRPSRGAVPRTHLRRPDRHEVLKERRVLLRDSPVDSPHSVADSPSSPEACSARSTSSVVSGVMPLGSAPVTRVPLARNTRSTASV